jgi:hypothetical protein
MSAGRGPSFIQLISQQQHEKCERLIKDDILTDFSNLDYCIDYIKEKYAKQVKEVEAKRSAGVLEIIHTNICGPFPVKSVDGFDSQMIFRAMAIFIQLKNVLLGTRSSGYKI